MLMPRQPTLLCRWKRVDLDAGVVCFYLQQRWMMSPRCCFFGAFCLAHLFLPCGKGPGAWCLKHGVRGLRISFVDSCYFLCVCVCVCGHVAYSYLPTRLCYTQECIYIYMFPLFWSAPLLACRLPRVY